MGTQVGILLPGLQEELMLYLETAVANETAVTVP